jgi:hypothetical protein
VPLPVGAVLVADKRTTVVADLSASTQAGDKSAEVVTASTRRPADLTPLMSSGLAVTIVVDTSAADKATLPAWLSAGARLILEAPIDARSTVIGTSAPASVIAPPQQGPSGIVSSLDGVQAHGRRDTAAALALAAKQFPDVAAGRKLTVFYTGAADAGGPAAAAVAAEFHDTGTILVVATTADSSPYWTTAAEETGGFFAPAGHPAVVPALDQVTTTLRGRYLIGFPTPPRLPAVVPVKVTTPDLTLTANVEVPAPPGTAPAKPSPWIMMVVLALIVVAAAGSAVAWLLARRARLRRRPPPIVIAHGRAAVPTAPPPEH